MKKAIFLGIGTLLLASPLAASLAMEEMGEMDHGGAVCGDPTQPLLSVSDFDGNGVVNDQDIAMLKYQLKKYKKEQAKSKHKKKHRYAALYDRNGDRALSREDLELAKQDIGQPSTDFDQEIAAMYQRFRRLQFVQSESRLMQWGYDPIPVALKGHGVHWFNQAGRESMLGLDQPDPNVAEGLNVESEDKRVHGVFWAYPAEPVFDNGATDYPTPGGDWQDGRVIEFSNEPVSITSRDHGKWHAHGGLCMTVTHSYDADGKLVRTGHANQHLSFNECQLLPSDEKQEVFDADGNVIAKVNMWATFWMLHVWLFDPNPNGLFAGTHPCVEPHGLDEATINGDREVPMFFRMMH